MSSWLFGAFVKELICAAGVSFMFFIFSHQDPVFYFSLIGLGTLGVLLLQGSLYWLFKGLNSKCVKLPTMSLSFLKGLYAFDTALLLVFPVITLGAVFTQIHAIRFLDFVIGLASYLFAVGEFINYFIFKVNMSRSEQRRMLESKRAVRARLFKEHRRAKRRMIYSNNDVSQRGQVGARL